MIRVGPFTHWRDCDITKFLCNIELNLHSKFLIGLNAVKICEVHLAMGISVNGLIFLTENAVELNFFDRTVM